MSQKISKHVRVLEVVTGSGLGQEVIVMQTDKATGDIYFIATTDLDEVDKLRMRNILDQQTTDNQPLYEAMYHTVLRNGVNALEYFNQYVKVKTSAGPVLSFNNASRSIRRVLDVPPKTQASQAGKKA